MSIDTLITQWRKEADALDKGYGPGDMLRAAELRHCADELEALADQLQSLSRAAGEAVACKTCGGVGFVGYGEDSEPCSDCVPIGELDLTAPKRIWLQIDTDGRASDRSEPFPSDYSGVTWEAEEVGGQEVEYVRVDLAHPAPAASRVTVDEVIKTATLACDHWDNNCANGEPPSLGMASYLRGLRAALTAVLTTPRDET